MKGKKKTQTIKINQNMLMIAVICIIAFIGLIIIFSKITNSNNKKMYIFDNNRLISIYQKGLYGFINRKGEVIVKPQYDYIMSDSGKYIVVEKDGKYYIIDNNGNIKLESKTSITYNADFDVYVADSKLLNNNLRQLSPKKINVVHSGYGLYKFISEDGETAGVMDVTGKIIYRQKIEKGDNLYIYIGDKREDQEEIYCVITPDDKAYQIINCKTGKIIEKYTQDLISAAGNNIFYIKDIGNDEIKTIFIRDNKVELELKGTTNVRYYENGYIEYQENDTVKYYNLKTKKTLDKEPNDLISADNRTEWEKLTGYKKISCTRQYGIVSDEKIILPCEYDKITYLPNKLYEYLKLNGKNYIIATKDKVTYLINLNNQKKVKEFTTDSTINTTQNSPFIYYYDSDNKIVVYNLNNNKEETYEAESLDVAGNYFKLHKDKKLIYYNSNFEKIYETDDEK